MNKNQEERIKNIFNQFDKNKNGTIEKKELATLCIALNDPLSQAELHDFYAKFDDDNSGYISYEEFLKYWFQVNLIKYQLKQQKTKRIV